MSVISSMPRRYFWNSSDALSGVMRYVMPTSAVIDNPYTDWNLICSAFLLDHV
jgi:hypothetical protein